MTGTPDDRLLAVSAAVRPLLDRALHAEDPPSPIVERIVRATAAAREADARVCRLLAIGAAVDACSRVPGTPVVRDPRGRIVTTPSVLLALLLDAGGVS